MCARDGALSERDGKGVGGEAERKKDQRGVHQDFRDFRTSVRAAADDLDIWADQMNWSTGVMRVTRQAWAPA